MGRELRKVPANWEHPKDSYGKYIPMLKDFYGDALEEWIKENNSWNDGTHPDLIKNPSLKDDYPFYAMYSGNPPTVEYFQTRKFKPEELTHIQLYENTSEGTPLSPVFPADQLDQLCEYAENNCSVFGSQKTTRERWKQMLSDGLVFYQSGNAIFI